MEKRMGHQGGQHNRVGQHGGALDYLGQTSSGSIFTKDGGDGRSGQPPDIPSLDSRIWKYLYYGSQ